MQEALKLEKYTYEDYLDIDQTTQERVELIFGEIYMMAGASALHQDVALNLAFILKNFVKDRKKCFPRVAPFDLKLNLNDNISIVQPDVMLFCEEKELPCVVFEVLSPSTALKDKTIKKDLYEQNGVKEYFLVNTEFKLIEKFVLENGKYSISNIYGEEDDVEIGCLNEKFNLTQVFE